MPASSIDYGALKQRTLGSGADEEAVTVNTRALIDKVLARYSGEWTVLRELLQNAADAGATRVTIKLETLPSATVPLPQPANSSALLKHVVAHHTIKRLLVTNNGQSFSEHDWSRLKRIAEGNPDETKIGAFGVGFYSVFSDCEEPFVSSGNEAMAFYWKGNSLFTRRLQIPESEATKDTSFVLDYRSTTSPVPSLLHISQFLASSLTFVGIQDLDLWLDDHNILALTKKIAPSSVVPIPRDIETKTSEGLMRIKDVYGEVAQIDGSWMDIIGWRSQGWGASRLESLRNTDPTPALRTFFARFTGSSVAKDDQPSRAVRSEIDNGEEDVTRRSSTVVFLNVNTATVETFTTRSFKDELERATKKPPPRVTKLAILTSPHVEEADGDVSGKALSVDVFGTILPTKSGRVFIGFPTHQTTGVKAHISAPAVIPTVERESIDLNARWVRTWNIELLRAAGITCRIVWSSEMAKINYNIHRNLTASSNSKVNLQQVTSSLPDAINVANIFSFQESTPSLQTGQILEDAFWTCNKKASIEVLSTCGVLANHEVRLAPRNLSFLDAIPILPERFASEAKTFVSRLVDYGLVTEVTVTDIKTALVHNALSVEQLHEFLAWLCRQATSGQLDQPTIEALLRSTVANEQANDGKASQVLVLANVRYFLNPNKIPSELPQTFATVPFKHTKQFSKFELEAIGWKEMPVVLWLRWLVEEAGNRSLLSAEHDLTLSPNFASQVLPVLSKQWESLDSSSKNTVVELLTRQTIIPTKFGMRRPEEAYFPSVKVFDDLPIVTGLSGVKEKFLVSLGVRKTLELGVVFDRLLLDSKPSGISTDEKSDWKHIGLIQYLASVRNDIPATDITKLQDKAICPKEDSSNPRKSSSQRYKVSSLYEPRPVLRELGLPILSWSGSYQSSSPEGKLLNVLGLKTFPSVGELIDIMARASNSGNTSLRDKAMGYFIANHHLNGYSGFNFLQVTVPFLPLQNSASLSAPSRCFTDEGAALFGFDVLRHDLASHAAKFGVRLHPPIDECIRSLVRAPPSSNKEARIVFAYFSGRLNEVNSTNTPRLREAKVVPIFNDNGLQGEKRSSLKHISPATCFLGESDIYGEIFSYVDFGNEANTFLIKCGSKHEPTKSEIAQILVNEPARISSTFQDPEKYLSLLRTLSASLKVLKKDKELFKAMKHSPFLLASKTVASPSSQDVPAENVDDWDEEDAHEIREWRLTTAANALIVDDYSSFNLFKTSILAAPQEEALEDLYYNLGSPLLSSLVEETASYGHQVLDQKPAGKLQKQIYERSRLFLHDQPPEGVRHDGKWLEKNLRAVGVASIKMRRSLRGRNLHHTERRSAAITQSGREYILWISGTIVDYYQVSQCLVHLLLSRPKLHSALTLEMLLKTDLKELGARGFNVSRILRQKAAETRLADQQQQIDEDRKRIEEQKRAWNARQVEEERTRQSDIPGGFPTDPPQTKPAQTPSPRDSGQLGDAEPLRNVTERMFQNWRNRFGLSHAPNTPMLSSSSKVTPSPNISSHDDAVGDEPPPYSVQDVGKRKSLQSSPVTAPHQLQQNLLSAIQRCRAYNSNALFSRGETNEIAETRSYCDEKMAQNLHFVADGKFGIHIFFASTSQLGDTKIDPSLFLTQNATGLGLFATLLKEIASIFAMTLASLNIFYDGDSKSIAFNRQGSIFCNYRYFQQLHERALLSSLSNARGEQSGVGDGGEQSSRADAHTDALLYWWVTLCHELAHNIVSDHSAEHSYYLEHFVIEYARKAMGKLASPLYGGDGFDR